MSSSSTSKSSNINKQYLTPCQYYLDSSDGDRQLAYATYGCSSSATNPSTTTTTHTAITTVLFFPGAGLGRAALPISEDRLRELRIRLILTDRPGSGNSDL